MQLDLRVIPPWLDEETSALVREKAELLAQRHPDVLAIILYGQWPGMKSEPWTGLIRVMSICLSLSMGIAMLSVHSFWPWFTLPV